MVKTDDRKSWFGGKQLIGSVDHAVALVSLLVFFGVLFFKLLSSHMLATKSGELYSGGSTWGDLAWHLSMLSNMAERGFTAVRENPIFPGARLSYPFIPDLISVWLRRAGASLQTSLAVPSLLAMLGSVAAIYLLARSTGATVFGTLVTPVLFLFNGSIWGCYYLWQDALRWPESPLSFTILHKDYSYLPENNLCFANFITDYLLPQRSADFGLLLGTVVVLLLWIYWSRGSRKHLVLAAVLLSGLPLVHTHTFVALVMVAGFLFLVEIIAERHNPWRTLSSWCLFALPLLLIALPQMWWIAPATPQHFLRLQLGWMKGSESLARFWLKNLGPYLFVLVLAFWAAKPRLKLFYLAFCGLFLMANLIIFQPNAFDNLKLISWWFLLSCVLTGSLIGRLVQSFPRSGWLLSLILLASMMATGGLTVWRELHLSWRMFSREDLALAQYVRDQTSKDALFLTSDKHNNPIPCLAGRRIVMGYRGWLWTHGIDYREREHDVMEMFQGSEQGVAYLRHYRVDYVLLEKDKRADFHQAPEFFLARFPILFRSPNYVLFKVSE